MKKMAIVLMATFVTFSASCGMKEMERTIDEQQNLLMAKDKEVVALEGRIADLEAEKATLAKKMKKLETEIANLKIEGAYLGQLERDYDELATEYDELKARVADIEAEKAELKKKLGEQAPDEVGYVMAAANEHPEAFADPEETEKVIKGKKTKMTVVVVKEKSKTATAQYTGPGAMPMPMPMPGAMPGAMPGMSAMPMMPGMPGVATFQPFPAAAIGKLYKAYPDSNLNIVLNGDYVKEGTWMRVWVDGTRITFAGAVAKLVQQEDGSAKYESLIPPGVDAYIPVSSIGPYVVDYQGCVMQANICVPLPYAKTKEVEDVRKHGVSLKFAD